MNVNHNTILNVCAALFRFYFVNWNIELSVFEAHVQFYCRIRFNILKCGKWIEFSMKVNDVFGSERRKENKRGNAFRLKRIKSNFTKYIRMSWWTFHERFRLRCVCRTYKRHLNRGSSKLNVVKRHHSSSSLKTMHITGIHNICPIVIQFVCF